MDKSENVRKKGHCNILGLALQSNFSLTVVLTCRYDVVCVSVWKEAGY